MSSSSSSSSASGDQFSILFEFMKQSQEEQRREQRREFQQLRDEIQASTAASQAAAASAAEAKAVAQAVAQAQAQAAVEAAATAAAFKADTEKLSVRVEMLSMAIATRQAASPTFVPTVFTPGQFKKYMYEHGLQKSLALQWWNIIPNFPESSKTFAHFCTAKFPSLEAGRGEEALQNYLMGQLKTLFKKHSIQPQCSFIDTHNKPLVGSTRKPDVTLVPKDEKTASLRNVVAIISLKLTIDEDATAELASMMLDLLVSNPRRHKITGIVTNCRQWQAVSITRLKSGTFEFDRTATFELEPASSKYEISPSRRAVIEFLLQPPYFTAITGLDMPYVILADDQSQRWNTWNLSSGSTSNVSIGEPLMNSRNQSNSPVILKQLVLNPEDNRHEKFFYQEQWVLEQIEKAIKSNSVDSQFNWCVPRIVAVIKSRWTLVLTPVGQQLHLSAITSQFVNEVFRYINGMWTMGFVDLDLRGRNMMTVLDVESPGTVKYRFFKVDFASVVAAGRELTEYHGTDRFAHPEILEALIRSKQPSASSSSSSSSSSGLGAQSPTSASLFALQFTPHLAHMVYSATATILWFINFTEAHKELIHKAGNDWNLLLQAWRKVRMENNQVDHLLRLAESGKMDESGQLSVIRQLADLADTVVTSRARSSSRY